MNWHDKKRNELGILKRTLRALGDDPDNWTLTAHEGPDILARSSLGIEVSEVLSTEHGRQRAYDHALASIHRQPVEQYIRHHGGKGGVITGAPSGLPVHRTELEPERAKIERWLEA